MKTMLTILLLMMSFTAIANDESNKQTTAQILEEYYGEFCKNDKLKLTVENGITKATFGDNEVGFFNTLEEYYNTYDPAIDSRY